jgi:hypothetical protein
MKRQSTSELIQWSLFATTGIAMCTDSLVGHGYPTSRKPNQLEVGQT